MHTAIGCVAGRMSNAQWFNGTRNVADISNAQATQAIAVVSIPIDSPSSAHLAVKRILPIGRGSVVVSGQCRGQINPRGASG